MGTTDRSERWMRAAVTASFWAATVARDIRGLTAGRIRRGPVLTDVNIEPSNLCNANCVFCGYQFQERARQEIADELVMRVIEAAKRAGVERLGLTPIVGEPLVHRRLESFVRAAVAPPTPLKVGLTTNAILLTVDRYRSLVDAGITNIDISMSFPDEEEYRRIYRSPKLKTVVANINAILDIYSPGTCQCLIALRTQRYRGWDDHPMLRRARERGWLVTRNLQFDDWSGKTEPGMAAEGLLVRPNRPKRLPCTMTYAGPHVMSDGRATACGCRDLDGRSELALDPATLFADLHGTYATGAISRLRNRFREGTAPEICQSCRHYNPVYEGETMGLRWRQLLGDMRAALRWGAAKAPPASE